MIKQTLSAVALLFALLLGPTVNTHAAAGKVIFAFGEVAAIDADGKRRELKRGADIEPGDLLKTLEGRAQVKFSDGGFVALQPRTEFKVNEFRYSGRPDDSGSAIFRLLRGGIRAVTGAIGKRNQRSYRVDTPVATIGIRGTGYTALVCAASSCTTAWGATLPDGLYTKTGDGVIYVENNAGTIDLPVGAASFVANIDSAPVETSAPPPTTTSTIQSGTAVADGEEEDDTADLFISGSQYGEGGGQQIIIGDVDLDALNDAQTLLQFIPSDQVVIGALTSAFSNEFISRSDLFVFTDGFALDNDTRISTAANAFIPPFAAFATGYASFSRDTTGTTDDILIERFSNGTLTNDFAFIHDPNNNGTSVGTIAADESIFQATGTPVNSMPMSGQASYILAGSSDSANVHGGPVGNGVVDASLNVNFNTAEASLFYQVDHAGTIYNAFHSVEPIVELSGNASNAYVFGANGGAAFTALGNCVGGCFSIVGGFFSGNTTTVLGNTPAAAGFVYTIFDTNPIQGAAALALDPASVMLGP